MSYTIKNYSEDYLEQQYEIGNVVLSEWEGAGQTSVEALKTAYSGENFDPEMKFYAFKGEEMIGFCTSAPIQNQPEGGEKKAFVEFPIVKPGFEDAAEQLYQTAIGTLRDKGYKAVRTRAGPGWTGTMELVEKYGYSHHSALFKRANFNPHEFDVSKLGEGTELPQLDYDKHTDQLRDLIQTEYNITTEQAQAAIDNLLNLKDQTLFHDIVLEGDKIVGRMLTYRQTTNITDAVDFTRPITIGEKHEEIRAKLFKSAIIKLRKMAEITKVQVYLTGNALENDEIYNILNLKFDAPLSFYERPL